jgi:predicted TIM-barrel fold metal-dependent hydrolase
VNAALLSLFYAVHTASPLFLLRLYLSGVFDRYPKLRLLVSQNGHSLLGLRPRVEQLLGSIPVAQRPVRKFIDVWQHNIFISAADVLDVAGMRALLEQIPIDRVLFAGNYPWEDKGVDLMNELRDGGILEGEEWEKVAWKNAEALFGLKGGEVRGKRVGGAKRWASFGDSYQDGKGWETGRR